MILKISLTAIYIILVVIFLVILAGAATLLYFAFAREIFIKTFKRKEPQPATDRSPNEIDQSDAIGKGRNWFYTHRMEFFNVQCNAIDGIKLAGYYRRAYDRDCKNVVILLHGYNEHLSMNGAAAKLFMSKIQCHILIPHERAHCMSGGRFFSYGLYESVDLNSWIEYARKMAGPDCRIYVYGRCMGGVAALLAAQQPDFSSNVAGIVVDSPYATFEEPLIALGKRRYKVDISFLYKWVKVCVQKNYHFDIDACNCSIHAADIRVPVLMFHGEADHIVDPKHSRRIYDAIVAPKRLVVIPNADHLQAYNQAPVIYEREVEKFIEQCVVRLVKLGRM